MTNSKKAVSKKATAKKPAQKNKPVAKAKTATTEKKKQQHKTIVANSKRIVEQQKPQQKKAAPSKYERIEEELPKDAISLQEILAKLWYGYFRPVEPLSLTEKREMREDYNRVADALNKIHPNSVIRLTESTKWVPTKMYSNDGVEDIEQDARVTTGKEKAKIVPFKPLSSNVAATAKRIEVKENGEVKLFVDKEAAKSAAPAKAVKGKQAKPATPAAKVDPAKLSKDTKQQDGESMYAWICRLHLNGKTDEQIIEATGRDKGFVRRNIKHFQTKGK